LRKKDFFYEAKDLFEKREAWLQIPFFWACSDPTFRIRWTVVAVVMTLPAFVVIAVVVAAAVVAVVVVAEVVAVVVEGERLVEPYFLLLDLGQFFPSQN
jgi:hypothetical protein